MRKAGVIEELPYLGRSLLVGLTGTSSDQRDQKGGRRPLVVVPELSSGSLLWPQAKPSSCKSQTNIFSTRTMCNNHKTRYLLKRTDTDQFFCYPGNVKPFNQWTANPDRGHQWADYDSCAAAVQTAERLWCIPRFSSHRLPPAMTPKKNYEVTILGIGRRPLVNVFEARSPGYAGRLAMDKYGDWIKISHVREIQIQQDLPKSTQFERTQRRRRRCSHDPGD